MNGNLVPDQRTDKNGVLSTRWVKPQSTNEVRLSSIPVPVISQSEANEHARLLDNAAATYAKYITDGDDYYDEMYETTVEDFAGFSDEMLSAIAEDSSNEFLKLFGVKNIMEGGKGDHVIRDFLAVHELMDTMEDYDNPEEAPSLVDSFKNYPGMEPLDSDRPYPEKRRQQAEAIMRLTEWIDQKVADQEMSMESIVVQPDKTYKIANTELVNYLIEHPNDASRIMDFIEERDSDNLDAIREFMNSESPSIANGVL